MTTLQVPLVAMHFRPPAKQVLSRLPAGARLRLVPEPENPYDAKAIQVHVFTADIPESQHSSLESMMEGTGTMLSEVLENEFLQLGYVADSEGKFCKKEGLPGNGQVLALINAEGGLHLGWEEVNAKLSFSPSGAPMVLVTV